MKVSLNLTILAYQNVNLVIMGSVKPQMYVNVWWDIPKMAIDVNQSVKDVTSVTVKRPVIAFAEKVIWEMNKASVVQKTVDPVILQDVA